MNSNLQIINQNHILTSADYIKHLEKENRLVYNGDPAFVGGTEFLASNEFDWHKSARGYSPADAVVGFGTNSLWDLALMTGASSILIADWSPWPIVAHAFILEPLIRIAESPQEFVCMVSGIPKSKAKNLSLSATFEYAKHFTLSKINDQKDDVMQLLKDLATDLRIDEIQMKCLTTYFRPRLGENLNATTGYGPLPILKSPNIANFTYYFEQRYNPIYLNNAKTVFSTQANFEFVKSIFMNKRVFYSVSKVNDVAFYKALQKNPQFQDLKKIALSLSNIFSCGYYNGLDNQSMQVLFDEVRTLFKNNQVMAYRTQPRDAPYEYFAEAII